MPARASSRIQTERAMEDTRKKKPVLLWQQLRLNVGSSLSIAGVADACSSSLKVVLASRQSSLWSRSIDHIRSPSNVSRFQQDGAARRPLILWSSVISSLYILELIIYYVLCSKLILRPPTIWKRLRCLFFLWSILKAINNYALGNGCKGHGKGGNY
ncbi:hypothetical protein KP509_34G058300 [Ceratopteris richardii]|uniref:Uncharacterized protein n=1 Tax=Ceratopteris richardii TaxID=49495 RepID=A0A8T2QLI7_CERRI|nr:hypothetical protein KP509_34G058300 [Ceratopteris richardii]